MEPHSASLRGLSWGSFFLFSSETYQLFWFLHLRAIWIPVCSFPSEGLIATGSWMPCVGNSDPAFTLRKVAFSFAVHLTLRGSLPNISSLFPSPSPCLCLPPLSLSPFPPLLPSYCTIICALTCLLFFHPKSWDLSFPLSGIPLLPSPLAKTNLFFKAHFIYHLLHKIILIPFPNLTESLLL